MRKIFFWQISRIYHQFHIICEESFRITKGSFLSSSFLFLVFSWKFILFHINFTCFINKINFHFQFLFTRYNIVFLVVTYLIPIFVMLFCYTVMGRELWGSRSIGEQTDRQRESMKSKKKVSCLGEILLIN